MGREVRRVPATWQHPRRTDGRDGYEPLADITIAEWDPEDGDPPDPADCMPQWSDAERTHWQMYEDTSEGTPISPVFATAEGCARWCADNHVSAFGSETAPYEWWLRVTRGEAGVGIMLSLPARKMELI